MEPLARRSRKRSFHGDEAGVLQEAQGLCPVVLRPIAINIVRGRRLLLMIRCPGNHEFPDHEKNGLDLDFLLLMSCAFLHEFPFFKIKQQAGNSFTRYLQRREKQFPEKQFLCHLRNYNECGTWILKHFQDRTSHITLKKSNLGIHDANKQRNREIDSQLDQIIFDLGIHSIACILRWSCCCCFYIIQPIGKIRIAPAISFCCVE